MLVAIRRDYRRKGDGGMCATSIYIYIEKGTEGLKNHQPDSTLAVYVLHSRKPQPTLQRNCDAKTSKELFPGTTVSLSPTGQ